MPGIEKPSLGRAEPVDLSRFRIEGAGMALPATGSGYTSGMKTHRRPPGGGLWLVLALLFASACSGESRPERPATPLEPAAPAALAAAVTFLVTVPASTPAAGPVHVAGSFQAWNPGSPAHLLARQPDGRWSITLDLPAGQPIQFKFTRGAWTSVEKGANGEEIANRNLVPAAGATYEFTVATWADLGTVVGDVEIWSHPPFLAGRTIRVYLPPGYDTSTDRYPVLYMHDGQNLFDVRTSFAGEWRVDESCEQLIAAGEIRPLIVVGIDNGGAARINEYTPWPAPGYGGGGGAAYIEAVITILKPEVDRRYRTLATPGQTFMAGSSLGGLISAWAGYTHDGVFGRVAAVSPSYWWAGDQMILYAAAQGRPTLARFYQDMGTTEEGSTTDANGNGVDDYIDDLRAMRDVALAQGFVTNLDFQSVEAAGQTHSEAWWAQRFPGVLRFLVGQWPTSGLPESSSGVPE
jgi:pullulanase